ncbi:hypothetical protein B0T26DRAFT_716429 [Lasiosphaeria miniovina]|uniref:Kinetochore protein mis14 n=1 Tax=Lasiosphaeria miniovina TaxID=1954250 RepID=A0AA40AC90_9PEZI|nr:uncharacterized protein B0T26DRAFT_716429 [Lasiosphaeria miniovina]KAK0713109.1 hypothetical protein B0T26DRAFT_716429 [Lasiosphaeria miniovina]
MESTSTVHRRIELQAPEDFAYLINNVRRAAADSINAAFPPVEGADGQEDELRIRIEEMVNNYIIQTFTLAAPNLTINGMPVDPELFFSSSSSLASPAAGGIFLTPAPEEQYEVFDSRKRARVEDLAREEEDLLRSIAALKRRVPQATASAWALATKSGLAADDAAVEAVRTCVETDGALSGKKTLEGLGPLDRQDVVEQHFETAVESLGRLKRDMPATVAKMERARVAAGYVATER